MKDTLRGSEKLFTTTSSKHQGTVFGGLLATVALFVGNRRQLVHRETRQSSLGEYYEQDMTEMSTEEVYQLGMSALYALIGVLIPVVLLFALFVLGSELLKISWILGLILLIDVLSVIGLVDLWYSLYGVISAGKRNGFLHFAIIVLTYVFAGKMVFLL